MSAARMAGTATEEFDVIRPAASPASMPGIRIDGAHQLGDAAASLPTPAPPPPDEENAFELLRKQARQLAQHLSQRQRENDVREARLNAQEAELENEGRSERLWLLEQRAQLAEQAEDLLRRECELQERAARVSAAEEHLNHSQQQADQGTQQREETLRRREEQLAAVADRLKSQRSALKTAQRKLRADRRRQQRSVKLGQQMLTTQRAAWLAEFRGLLEGIELRRGRLAEQQELLKQQEAWLAEQAARWSDREEVLQRSEEALEVEWNELRQHQEGLRAEKLEWEATRGAAAEEARLQREQHDAKTIMQREALERRSQELDSRRRELEQLQDALRQLHKETLEIRLASEELLAQLAGSVPSAALTSSISRLRRRLDDQFHVARADLSQQRSELETLRTMLAERHQQVLQQKLQLDQWVQQREAAVEQQAARLMAREQELDSQQEQLASLQQRWQQERAGYQREIRRLLAQMRSELLPG